MNIGRWVGIGMLSSIVAVPFFFFLFALYAILVPWSPFPSTDAILGSFFLTILGLAGFFGWAFRQKDDVSSMKKMGAARELRMTHPFLKGLGMTLLLSFSYAFTLLTSSMGPSVWSLLQYSFLPVVVGGNIGGAALYMRSEYRNMNGLGRYAAGVVTIVGLDAALFFLFLLLLFASCATSGC